MNMKSKIFALTFIFLFFATAALADQTRLKLPEYKKVKLPNGMTVLLMEQHEVPFISFDMKIRAGGAADPTGKEGVASLTADLLRKGTKTRTADQIASELDFVGGSLDFSTRVDYSIGQAEFLKKDLVLGLDLLSDVLINPIF